MPGLQDQFLGELLKYHIERPQVHFQEEDDEEELDPQVANQITQNDDINRRLLISLLEHLKSGDVFADLNNMISNEMEIKISDENFEDVDKE